MHICLCHWTVPSLTRAQQDETRREPTKHVRLCAITPACLSRRVWCSVRAQRTTCSAPFAHSTPARHTRPGKRATPALLNAQDAPRPCSVMHALRTNSSVTRARASATPCQALTMSASSTTLAAGERRSWKLAERLLVTYPPNILWLTTPQTEHYYHVQHIV